MIELTDIRADEGITPVFPGNGWIRKKTKEIILDFGSDRHHAVTILEPFTAERVADSLRQLAYNILSDPRLKG